MENRTPQEVSAIQSQGGMKNDSPKFTGIFCDTAVIKEARSVSNVDIYKNQKPVDCGIEFKLDIGKDFFPLMTIAGNFKIENVNGQVKVSPGSATRVKIALDRLGVKWTRLNPDNSIPDDVLAQCVGKEIYRLQYPYKYDEDKQKNKYTSFTEIFLSSVPEAKRKLEEKYHNAVAKGYIKPIIDKSTSFPAPTEAPAANQNF